MHGHYNECMKSLRRNSTKYMNQWHYNECMMNSCMTEKKIRTRTPLLVVRVRIFFVTVLMSHTPSSLLLRSIQHNHSSMSLLMLLLSVFTSLSDEEGSEWKSSEQCNHHGSFTLKQLSLITGSTSSSKILLATPSDPADLRKLVRPLPPDFHLTSTPLQCLTT